MDQKSIEKIESGQRAIFVVKKETPEEYEKRIKGLEEWVAERKK